MSSSVRNLVFVVVVVLLIGGFAYTRISGTEQEVSDNTEDQISSDGQSPYMAGLSQRIGHLVFRFLI